MLSPVIGICGAKPLPAATGIFGAGVPGPAALGTLGAALSSPGGGFFSSVFGDGERGAVASHALTSRLRFRTALDSALDESVAQIKEHIARYGRPRAAPRLPPHRARSGEGILGVGKARAAWTLGDGSSPRSADSPPNASPGISSCCATRRARKRWRGGDGDAAEPSGAWKGERNDADEGFGVAGGWRKGGGAGARPSPPLTSRHLRAASSAANPTTSRSWMTRARC